MKAGGMFCVMGRRLRCCFECLLALWHWFVFYSEDIMLNVGLLVLFFSIFITFS